MITISEKTPPKGSYEKLIKNPLAERTMKQIISELSIQDSNKENLSKEFSSVSESFKDFSYTGDIDNFKINLYTSLSDIPGDITLLDLISTEEFIAKTTKKIENSIFIGIGEENSKVSLVEYIKTIRKREDKQHILPVLRGLYSFDKDLEIRRDTTELFAAIKKHIVNNSTNDSIQDFLSLVEKKKQNESILREDELHYNNIKSYTEHLPEDSAEYSDMISKVKTALEYFSDSSGYKKEKLDKLMFNFLREIAHRGISLYEKEKFGSPLSDLFKVEFSQKIDISELSDLVKNHNEYKEFFKKLLEDKKENCLKTIQIFKERIEKFNRPTREERVNSAPFRGAPIKSDQEYNRELENLRDTLDMYEKNLELIESYLIKMA